MGEPRLWYEVIDLDSGEVVGEGQGDEICVGALSLDDRLGAAASLATYAPCSGRMHDARLLAIFHAIALRLSYGENLEAREVARLALRELETVPNTHSCGPYDT